MLSVEVQSDDDSSRSSISSLSSDVSVSSQAGVDQTRSAASRKRRFVVRTQLSRINLGSQGPTSFKDENNTEEQGDKRLRLSSSSSTSSSLSLESNAGTRASSSSPAPESCYDVSDAECSQSSVRYQPLFKDSVIGNGEFELVGDGKECKAVHVPTQTIHHCRVLNEQEHRAFLQLSQRLEMAHEKLNQPECEDLRRMMLPRETRVLHSSFNNLHYVISPDHHSNLQTLFAMRNEKDEPRLTEQQCRRIFEQVVRLVSLCHRLGIYFRDFKPKKIVFARRNSFEIRFMFAVQELILTPFEEDEIQLQLGCPAYTAPEMIPAPNSKSHFYRAGPADVWSLGVLLYTLLTGRAPFMARNPRDLFRMIKQCRVNFQLKDRVSFPAKLVCHMILKVNPDDRPTADDLLTIDWVRDPEDEPTPFAVKCPASGTPYSMHTALLSSLGGGATVRNSIYRQNPRIRHAVSSFIRRNLEAMPIRPPRDQRVPILNDDSDADVLGLCLNR